MHTRAISAIFLIAVTLNSQADVSEQGAAEGTASSENKDVHRFDLWELQVEGVTLLDRTLIERSVYPFLGPGKTVEDVESAAESLEDLYRSSGYTTIVVTLPEQEVVQGVVRLKVVEGSVDRLRISGSRYYSLGRIREGVPSLAKGNVPRLDDLQDELKELNQASPDRSITPIFRAGRTPGTVEVELRVKDELPLHGDFEVNNRYSRDTTKLRASGALRYANLWQRGHSLSVMYQTSPENTDEVQVFSGTYVWPLGGGGVVAAYLFDSKSDVATAGDLSVLGNGTILGGRYVQPLPPHGNYYHNFTLGIDYKDFEENVRTLDGPGFNTPIDYVNFMGRYSGTRVGDGRKLTAGVTLNFGVRGLGNDLEEFENKRFLAKPNYMHLGLFGNYTHNYKNGLQWYGSVDAQLANSPLVSNEQYSAGGAESVRGYFESQALGDDGITVKLELRSPSYAEKLSYVRDLRLLAFIDAASLRVRHPLAGQVDSHDIHGAGIGMRLEGSQGLDASLDWAWPLTDAVGVEKGDSRAHFNLHYGF